MHKTDDQNSTKFKVRGWRGDKPIRNGYTKCIYFCYSPTYLPSSEFPNMVATVTSLNFKERHVKGGSVPLGCHMKIFYWAVIWGYLTGLSYGDISLCWDIR